MGLLFNRFTLMAVGFLGLYGYLQWDKQTNYKQTMAIVQDIDNQCYMKKVTHYGVAKRTRTTKEGPCDIVRVIHETHPEFEGYRLIQNTKVEVEYQDDEGNFHTAKIYQRKHSDGREIQIGDDLPILIHKEDPERAQPV